MTRKEPEQGLVERTRELARRTHRFVTHDLWSVEAGGLPTFRAMFVWVYRVLFIAIRGFRRDRCFFHAAALTYITALSIVPVLAFMFSMAKGLGAYDDLVETAIEPALERVFPVEEESVPGDAALVAGAAESGSDGVRAAIEKILEFVSRTDASKLGLFGLAVLLWAVVKMLGSVENSFNEIWGVPSSRSVVRKISDYLAIVVVIPIFMLTAMAITASEQSVSAMNFLAERLHMGPVLDVLLRALPLVVVWIAFTFIYMCLPNKRMKLSSALVGGIGGGTLWQLLQVAHFNLQASAANYNALYAGFAAIPILLVWICLSWVTVLFGAELAAAHQKAPTYRGSAYTGPLEQAFKEVLALRALTLVAEAFLRGRRPWNVERLSERMNVPELWIDEVVEDLVQGEVLVRLEGEGDRSIQPSRALESISVSQVLSVLRGDRMQDRFPAREPLEERVQRTLDGLDRALADSAHNPSLRDLGEEAIRDGESDAAAAVRPVLDPG